MPRNLDRRVEVLTPVVDSDLQARLDEILDVALRDDVLAWTLDAEGRWTRVPPGGEVESHLVLQQLTMARAARTAVSTSIV
jgi:polyphosphate kinase